MQPNDPNLPVEQKMAYALLVIILDERIRGWLQENDPMALRQALDAVQAWKLAKERG